MINLRNKGKNLKDNELPLPYEKEADSDSRELQAEDSENDATIVDGQAQSGGEFLLSIAGLFSSGETDISERVEEYVADALRKKYT